MSMYCSRNLGPYADEGYGVVDLKDWLTSGHGGTRYWSVVCSGDGLAAYSSSGDVITTGGSGAGGFANIGAWMVLEDPDGNTQIEFSRRAATTLRAFVSPSAAFSGGNATTRATATDEQGICYGGDAYTIAFPSGSCDMHLACEGDDAVNGSWPFWLIGRKVSTGAGGVTIIMDAVTENSAPDETQAGIFAVAAQGGNSELEANGGMYLASAGSSQFMAYRNYGDSDLESCDQVTYARFCAMGSYVLPGAADADPHTSRLLCPEVPVGHWLVADPAYVGDTGYKGNSYLIRWRPNASQSYGDVVYVLGESEFFLVVDDVCLRGWPDSSAPTITP